MDNTPRHGAQSKRRVRRANSLWFWGLAFALSLLSLGALTVDDALAHAYLQKSDPAAGATLALSPDHLHFYFSEDVDIKFSQLTLMDAHSKKLADLTFRLSAEDPLKMDINLPKVGEGTYTVAWRVMSAVDGHTTKGTFPFRIGKASASCFDTPPLPKETETETVQTPWARVVFHWLGFLAIIGLAGAFFFQALVIRPALRKANFPAEHWASVTVNKQERMLWCFWGLFIVTSVLDLFAQAMSTSELSLTQVLQSDVMGKLLQTRYGLIWLARIALALIIALPLAMKLNQRRWGLWVLVGLSALTLLSISLSSHGAALKENTALAIYVDWLHLLASAVWIGGLLQLVSVVLPALRLIPDHTRYKLVAQIVPRFSNLALSCVILLVATGLYSAFRQVASFEALFTTTYGRAIMIKHVLLIFTTGVALVHFLDSVPRLARIADWISQANAEQAQKLIRRFRGMISTEVTMVIGVLFFAGILTLVPTAAKPASDSSLAIASGPIALTELAQNLEITLKICSDFVGENEFDLMLIDKQTHAPISDLQKILIGFNYTSNPELGGLNAVAGAKGDGHYRAKGAFMNLAGVWDIVVSVFRADRPAPTVARFTLTIKSQMHQHADVHQTYGSSSIEKGRVLFSQHCVSCHGDSGRGIGPDAPKLKLPPADLVAHRGHHGDSDFLAIIRDGTGLVMPSFKDKLSEEEIRQIISYIRQLKE